MSIRKKRDKKCDEKPDVLYIPLEEVAKLHDAYLSEMEKEKTRLNTIRDADVIKAFYGTLIKSYNGAIALKSRECKVDYDIRAGEIKARAEEQTPERRWRWWSPFRKVPNRAQAIIDERAELDADRIHSAAEKQLDEDWEKLKNPPEPFDEFEPNDGFDEPGEPDEPAEPKTPPKPQPPASPAQPVESQEPPSTATKQLPGQLRIDDVQPPAQVQAQAQPGQQWTKQPRPPRGCRK